MLRHYHINIDNEDNTVDTFDEPTAKKELDGDYEIEVQEDLNFLIFVRQVLTSIR